MCKGEKNDFVAIWSGPGTEQPDNGIASSDSDICRFLLSTDSTAAAKAETASEIGLRVAKGRSRDNILRHSGDNSERKG
jgi:hypothetical protein